MVPFEFKDFTYVVVQLWDFVHNQKIDKYLRNSSLLWPNTIKCLQTDKSLDFDWLFVV